MPNELLLTERERKEIVGAGWDFTTLGAFNALCQAQLAKASPLIRADERAKTLREVELLTYDYLTMVLDQPTIAKGVRKYVRDALKSGKMPEVGK